MNVSVLKIQSILERWCYKHDMDKLKRYPCLENVSEKVYFLAPGVFM